MDFGELAHRGERTGEDQTGEVLLSTLENEVKYCFLFVNVRLKSQFPVLNTRKGFILGVI